MVGEGGRCLGCPGPTGGFAFPPASALGMKSPLPRVTNGSDKTPQTNGSLLSGPRTRKKAAWQDNQLSGNNAPLQPTPQRKRAPGTPLVKRGP